MLMDSVRSCSFGFGGVDGWGVKQLDALPHA